MRSVCRLSLLIFIILLAVGCENEGENPSLHHNTAPLIIATGAGFSEISPGAQSTLICYATDADEDSLNYIWSADYGLFPYGRTGQSIKWEAPIDEGIYNIAVIVYDGMASVQGFTDIRVSEGGNFGEVDFEFGSSGLEVAMVWITPGSFVMGSLDSFTVRGWAEVEAETLDIVDPDSLEAFIEAYLDSVEYDADADKNETPLHTVTFEAGFWIGKYEVTQMLWETAMDTNPSVLKGPCNPVDNVSWDDIKAFIEILNSAEGNDEWRLPSESEWEYACRAGNDSTRFPWGNDTLYQEYEKWAICGHYNGIGSHAKVGSRLPNAWGVHDMLGNVWEWVEDKYHSTYRNAPTDGSAWTSGLISSRVMRGGSWYDIPQNCRPAQRNKHTVLPYRELRYRTVGFRLVRDGPAPQ